MAGNRFVVLVALLMVVAFSQRVAVVTRTSPLDGTTVSVARAVTGSGNGYGECNLSSTYGDGYTTFHASCRLTLPTPCHSVEYSWLPGKEGYVFTVWIKQKGGVCAQVVKEVEINDTFRAEGNASATYRIVYSRVSPVATAVSGGTDVAHRRVPAVLACVRERLQAREQLRELKMALYQAEERGDSDKAADIRQKIAEVEEELENLPNVSSCARSSGSGASLQKVKNLYLKLRVVNPCEKVRYIQEAIREKRAELNGTLSEEERETLRKEIGVLIDLREKVTASCNRVKSDRACRGVVALRNRVGKIREKAETGELSGSDMKRINELSEEVLKVERRCFSSIESDMERHPCIAARVLEIELKRVAENDSAVVEELYREVQKYREKCREKVDEIQADVSGGDVMEKIGEIELAKYQVLMDSSTGREDRVRKIRMLEKKKAELVKAAFRRAKRVRVSAAVRVRVKPGSVELDGENISASGATVEVPTEDGTVNVSLKADHTEISGRLARLRVRGEVELDAGKLRVRGRTVKLPDEIAEKLKARFADMELKEEGNGTVYAGNVTRRVRLLAVIPLEARLRVRADAETGRIISVKKPWWMVFAID